MGWRAIRLGLDRPALLEDAGARASEGGGRPRARLMFPMVAEVVEFERAKAIVKREQNHLARHGHAGPERLVLGTMIEVPSLLFQLDELFRAVDFASVGSNDLMQFVMASDRSNTRLAGRFDPLNPAFLRALRAITPRRRRAPASR